MANIEYDYDVLNPGQYPAQAQDAIKRRTAAGWTILNSNLNYNEIALLWVRTPPEEAEPSEDAPSGDVLDLANHTLTHGGVTYKLVPTEDEPPLPTTEGAPAE